MAKPSTSFDADTIKTLLKRASGGEKPFSFAYGHASSAEKCGLAMDMRKPGKGMSQDLKKSSKDIGRVSFGTFTVTEGELRLKPEKPIKGMIKHLVKRFRAEGLRKYTPVLVDAKGQVIDEDSLPDEDQNEAAQGPDPEAVKKQLVLVKKQVDALKGDAGGLPDLMTRALKQFKAGDLPAVVESLRKIAAGLKEASNSNDPAPKQAAALKQIEELLPKAVTRLKNLPSREAQAQVAPLAKEVQRLLKAGDAPGAAGAYKQLAQALKEAEGNENTAKDTGGGQKPLDIWNEAKERADEGIRALQVALRAENHPATTRIADLGLAGLSDGTLQTRMMTALMDHSKDPQNPKMASAVGGVLQDYRKFLGSDLVQHCDKNPFGVTLNLAPILGQALDKIEKSLAG